MTATRTLLVLGLLAVLVVGLVVWLDRGQEPGLEGVEPSPAAETATPPPPGEPAPPGLRGAGVPPVPRPALPLPAVPNESPGTGTVEVHVLDEDAASVEGAVVRARQQGGPEDQSRERRTNSDGLAAFADMPAGTWWISVTHDAFAEGWAHAEVRADEAARAGVRLQRRIPVEGRVLDARTGDPIAGARVLLSLGGAAGGRTKVWVGMPPLGSTSTDGDGRFQIGVDPDTVVSLRATADDYADATTGLIRTQPGDEIVLRLFPGGTVRGVVLRPDGTPCTDAKVFVVPSDQKPMLQNPRTVMGPDGPVMWTTGDGMSGTEFDGEVETVRARRATTDGSGRFEVAHLALPCELHVLAEGPGGFRGGTGPVALDEHRALAEAEVALEPRRAIVVRVVGPDGTPRQGVRVGVEGVNHTTLGVSFLDPRGDGTWSSSAPAPSPGGATRFPNLAPGSYTIVVAGAADASIRRPVELYGDADAEVVLEVEAPQVVEGVVVDVEGKAIAAAQVRWQGVPKAADASGRFRIEWGGHEDATLEVWSRWHLPETLEVREPEDPLRVVLEKKPVVTGKLVPYEGADTFGEHMWVAEHPAAGFAGGATLAEDGRFRYPLNRAHEASWILLLPSGAADVLLGPFVLAPNEEHDVGLVELDPGRVVEGRVIDEKGQPIGAARVRAHRPGRREMRAFTFSGNLQATTADDGTFRIERVHRGAATILATHARYAPATYPDSGDGRLTLAMRPPSFIDGRLVDARGEPLVRGQVHVEGELSDAIPEYTGAQTDAEGRFRVGPLSAGLYQVRVRREGRWHALGEVELAEGQVAEEVWTVP